jgi:hypothetical protein
MFSAGGHLNAADVVFSHQTPHVGKPAFHDDASRHDSGEAGEV